MRIAVVTETYPPEVNGVALTLARAVKHLQARGHLIEMIRPRQACDADESPDDLVLTPGAPIPLYRGLRFGFPTSRKLTRRWRDMALRPDVVHVATEGPLGWAAVNVARAMRIPSTSDFRTNFHQYSRHYGLGAFEQPIRAYLRMFHNRTQRTFVPTRALQASLKANGFFNVAVASRGVDTLAFSPAHRDPLLRRRWGVERDDLVVLYAGRLASEKNIALVLQSFALIRANDARARLVLVGDGPWRNRLAAQCPDAIFAGLQQGEALAAHYASADLFLFPSLTETFGNVTVEALASGLAVVAFKQAAAGAHITDGLNGRVVPPDSSARFIQAALDVSGDLALRERLRSAARHSALQLSWDRVLADFERELLAVAVIFKSEQRVDERTCLV